MEGGLIFSPTCNSEPMGSLYFAQIFSNSSSSKEGEKSFIIYLFIILEGHISIKIKFLNHSFYTYIFWEYLPLIPSVFPLRISNKTCTLNG